MMQLLAGFVATMTVCQARVIANGSHPAGFLSGVKRQLRGEEGMPPRTPSCPPGYIDQTDGAAYWWGCAKNCPGLWPWSDAWCGCACVLPDEYRAILVERASREHEAAAARTGHSPPARAPAPTSAAAGDIAANTYVAPPAAIPAPRSQSRTPSPSAAAHAAVIATAVAAPSPATPVPLGWAARSNTGKPTVPVVAHSSHTSAGGASSVAQTPGPKTISTRQPPETVGDGDGKKTGLSNLAIALISVAVTIVVGACVLAASVYIQICNSPKDIPLQQHPLLIRIALNLTALLAPQPKLSRVEPIQPALGPPTEQPSADLPDSSQKLSPPQLFSSPPTQHYAIQKIQPVAQLILYPDVSSVSRKQKEFVMNGGWTSGLSGLNTPPPRPSNGSTATRTPRPSDGSTPSRTPRPSNGNTPARTPRPSNGSTPSRTPRPSNGSTPSRTPRPSNGSTPNRTPRPSNGTIRSASLPPPSTIQKDTDTRSADVERC